MIRRARLELALRPAAPRCRLSRRSGAAQAPPAAGALPARLPLPETRECRSWSPGRRCRCPQIVRCRRCAPSRSCERAATTAGGGVLRRFGGRSEAAAPWRAMKTRSLPATMSGSVCGGGRHRRLVTTASAAAAAFAAGAGGVLASGSASVEAAGAVTAAGRRRGRGLAGRADHGDDAVDRDRLAFLGANLGRRRRQRATESPRRPCRSRSRTAARRARPCRPTFLIQRTIVPSAIDSPICGITTSVAIGSPSLAVSASFGVQQFRLQCFNFDFMNVSRRRARRARPLRPPPPSSDARESCESALRRSIRAAGPRVASATSSVDRSPIMCTPSTSSYFLSATIFTNPSVSPAIFARPRTPNGKRADAHVVAARLRFAAPSSRRCRSPDRSRCSPGRGRS